jgi:type II secretory pathway pseudopilin PulG
MLATVLLISLTAALPSIYTQGQREREEELIFRGNEYARAIAMYRRQFRRFPTSVKDLVQTNSMRFLRRPYTDPMTRKGKWRFVHADASGTPIDSRTFSRPKPPKPLGDSSPSSSNSPGLSDTSTGAGTGAGQEGESGEKSSFFGDSKGIQGAFIVGVASMSNKNSIRVYNNKTRYSDWEFLGIEMGTGGGIPGQGGGVPPGGQQGRPGSGFAGPGQQGGLPIMPPLTAQ